MKEFRVNGVEMYNTNTNTQDCPVSVQLGSQTLDIATTTFKVTYDNANTATITSYDPQTVSILGGTTLTFTGTFTGVSASTDVAGVYLDDTACTVSTTNGDVSATTIKCATTAVATADLFKPSNTNVLIKNKGTAVIVTARDIPVTCLWSSRKCWNGEPPPVSNEMVVIGANQRMVYDSGYDTTTKSYVYAAIIISGGGQLLFFDDSTKADQVQELHSKYIFIQQGTFQIGSETARHCNKIEIILHGNKYDQ